MVEDAAVLSLGQTVLRGEAAALAGLADRLDGAFSAAVRILGACSGRVVVAGMGKSGHVARKIAATLSSTGTPAYFLHAAEGAHGDLGVLQSGDVAVLLSKSGETGEVVALLPFLKRLGIGVVSMTNVRACTLARAADAAIVLEIATEVCPLDLAPTTTTTAMLALGDALAIALMGARSFGRDDFARIHPAGQLGRLLLSVRDLMQVDDLPCVGLDVTVREALAAILNHKNRGIAIVVDAAGLLAGVVADGDLKRLLLRHEHLLELPVGDVMTKNPQTIAPEALVGEALARMEGRFTSLVVVAPTGEPLGLLHIHDILEARVL